MLNSVYSQHTAFGPYFGPIFESDTGAWQQNLVVAPTPTILSVAAVYACVTGIASDIAKMRVKLVRDNDGIWDEVTGGSPFLPVLSKPNHYQTRLDFLEQWMISLLLHGNAYVLKQRNDARGLVTALYVLHPTLVKPLVAEDGSVYYDISKDDLSEVKDKIIVPASEIIHHRMNCLWHPLVGVSPIYACAATATMAGKIQTNSTSLFTNRSMPGGWVKVPGEVKTEHLEVIKANFNTGYSGTNLGKIAVLSDGMEFMPLTMTAEDTQLIEQLNFSVQDIARAFKYPVSKLSVSLPYQSQPEVLQTIYYTDCLQIHIEKIEENLGMGLDLPSGLGIELDLDNLLRMDTAAQIDALSKAVGSGLYSPDEGRFKLNLRGVKGGNSPYLQQQNYSLAALAKRDAQEDPFGKSTPAPQPAPQPAPTEPTKALPEDDYSLEDVQAELMELVQA